MSAQSKLTELLAGRRLPHAILAECANQQAADGFARQLALALIFRQPSQHGPCEQCASCKKAKAGSHPDLLSYTGEGKSQAISVDQVRQIRAQAYTMPNESQRKVLLLHGVQTMLHTGQNALLKILEEPPSSAVFILTTTNRFSLLETVRSRVRVVEVEGSGTPQDDKHREDAMRVLELLSRGEEAQLLALLAGYEKDRPAFVALLNELRSCLAQQMAAGGYKGGGAIVKPAQLWAFAAITESTITGVGSNVGGNLLGCALCAEMFEVSERIL